MADEPPLVRHYLEFCRHRNGADKQHCVDLSDAKWLYPTTILPIVSLIVSKGPGFKYKQPKNPAVSIYNLDEFSSLDGTLISFQMHLPIHHIDIYEGGYL